MKELPEIPPELLDQRFPGGFTLRDEANAIVAWALRNGPLEDLHAGKHSKLIEDDSLSRITDNEMKELIIHASERIESLLRLKEDDPKRYAVLIKGHNISYCGTWERSSLGPKKKSNKKNVMERQKGTP
ncbi:MAG: hypothetical protein ACJ8FY_11430 [Gemmataceae bacterium]